jgi:hypothetical protein
VATTSHQRRAAAREMLPLVERFAQLLFDDLQGCADNGVVAGGPSSLLARLDGFEVGGVR